MAVLVGSRADTRSMYDHRSGDDTGTHSGIGIMPIARMIGNTIGRMLDPVLSPLVTSSTEAGVSLLSSASNHVQDDYSRLGAAMNALDELNKRLGS